MLVEASNCSAGQTETRGSFGVYWSACIAHLRRTRSVRKSFKFKILILMIIIIIIIVILITTIWTAPEE